MSKRQEIRARQKAEKMRNRILVIVLVMVAVLIIVFALILPGLKGPKASTIVQITPVLYKAVLNKTSMGDSHAPVKIDVWEDFQCSGCEYYSKNIELKVIQSFVETGKVYYTVHMFPFIDSGQGESHQAANAAMCAAAQGHFWTYHDMLFANWLGENAGSFTDARLIAIAQSVGLNMSAFNQCFQANTYANQIAQDYQTGTQMGVPPTPGIFINGKAVISSAGKTIIPSFKDISNIITAALSGK
jgi:protein-disulfide isomerase